MSPTRPAARARLRRATGLGTTELGTHIERAATELAVIVRAGVEQHVADDAWSSYQHEFAGNARRADRDAGDLDFDSPLMRLAACGRQAPPQRDAA